MIKKIFLFLVITSLVTYSQDAGNTGLSFLRVGASARNIGASDIGFLDSDPSSVFYNPAAVNQQETESILFTHQAWIQDLSSEVVNTNFSFWGLPFSVGVNTTKISGFEARTIPSENPDTEFDVNYFYGSLSTGFNLYENLDFGVTIKYLYEGILSDDASGTGYDLGIIYGNIIYNLNIGASIRNLGSMQKLRNKSTELPSDFIFNATYKLQLSNSDFTFLPVAGIQKYLDHSDVHIHIGTEAKYNNQFAIRFGYITGYESRGLTAGAGLYWAGFNIDYAYTPFSYGIGNASTISLMYTF